MSKKYLYLLLFVIAALVIATLILKPGFWKKDSSSFDFLIDNMQIMSTVDYVGNPEKNEYDKVYIQKPFATTRFELTDDSRLSDFYWHITSPSLDTMINDKESFNYFFLNEGHYLVSLCKDEKNCISKWVYVLNQKDYDVTLAHNSVEKPESETQDIPPVSVIDKGKKPDDTKPEGKKSSDPVEKANEEKNILENYRIAIQELFSGVQNAESTLTNIKQAYPRVSSNSDYGSLVSDASQIKKRINDIFNFKKQIFKVGDSQIEPRLGSIQNDFINLRNRIILFTNDIAKNPPVDPPPPPKNEPTKPKPPVQEENTDFSCNSRGQTGISSADWCYNNEFVTTGSVSIKPSRNLQLTDVAVFGSDVGKVIIRITGNDGTDEKKNASLNGGRSVISLSDLYIVLKKGNNYTMTATAVKKRENIDALLGNAQKCSKETYSDANISITYNGAVVFANLKYCY